MVTHSQQSSLGATWTELEEQVLPCTNRDPVGNRLATVTKGDPTGSLEDELAADALPTWLLAAIVASACEPKSREEAAPAPPPDSDTA